jgi:L-ascorbate metabolism protein UlaG (beta-lactamase superfamily)
LPELLALPPGKPVRLHWLGQAGFVIDGAERRLVIDPYLSNSLAEKYRGRKFPHVRMMPPPVTPGQIARVDVVLATHHHTDHLDPGTLPALMAANSNALLVVPAAARNLALTRAEIDPERLCTLDAGETATIAGIEITAVRAAHETLEQDDEGFYRFLGYALRIGGNVIFHSGDTIPFPGQVDEVAALGADLALFPVSGRDAVRKANGVPGNMDMTEALALAHAAGIPQVIAHHFDLFDFNTVPRADIEAAARSSAAPMLMPACTSCAYSSYPIVRDGNQTLGAG